MQIRNFSIIAHIDHGKSTLSDRLLMRAGAITEREFHNQMLDDMDLERERGITIKASAVTVFHEHQSEKFPEKELFMLNFIDTPGHVDFHYEVQKALQACEGAILVVDATQGVEKIGTGAVGFMVAGIKDLYDVRIGDSVTDDANRASEPLPGYKPIQQMVYCDFYPGGKTQYDELRDAMDRLQLNDSSFTFEPESSDALGFGFRCGFLGLLHMEIIQERLEREFNIEVIQTAPTVTYEIKLTDGSLVRIDSPSELPNLTHVDEIREPYIQMNLILPSDSVGVTMKLGEDRRGT